MYVISPEGQLALNYNKHFLYETDYKFCRVGERFRTVQIRTKSGHEMKVGVGICMDLNPEDFGDYSLFEIANFFLRESVDFIGSLSPR